MAFQGWLIVDLDIARDGPRASYERCGAYVVKQAGADLCLRSRGGTSLRGAPAGARPFAAGYRGSSIRTCTCGSTTPQFPFAEGARVPDARRHAGDAAGPDEGQRRLPDRDDPGDSLPLRQPLPGRRAEALPGMFQGVCRVDPLDPAAPDQLSRACTEAGLSRRAAEPVRRRLGRLVPRPADAAAVEALPGSEGAHDRAGAHRRACRKWALLLEKAART